MQRRAAGAYAVILVVIAALAGYAIVTGRAAAMNNPEHMVEKAWAIAGLAGLTAVVLLAAAYMPVRGD